MKNSPYFLIIGAMFLAGCAFPLFSQPTELVIPTSMVIIPATLEPTFTQTVAPTATPYQPINAVVSVENFIVRTGPGKVFSVLHVYPENTILIVLGQAPGSGEWVLVQTPDHLSAWAMVEFIDIQGDLSKVPYIEPIDAYQISGKVVDTIGNPVWGVYFAISQGSGADEQRTEAETDKNGVFMGYLPTSATGTWFVGFVSVNPKNNILVDANGKIAGTIEPDYRSLLLPQTPLLNFTWK
jgi:hypothetical protein